MVFVCCTKDQFMVEVTLKLSVKIMVVDDNRNWHKLE